MAVINDDLISFATLERAHANEDGSLKLQFVSGLEVDLSPTSSATLAKTLKAGIQRAQQMQAVQAAQQLGILTH